MAEQRRKYDSSEIAYVMCKIGMALSRTTWLTFVLIGELQKQISDKLNYVLILKYIWYFRVFCLSLNFDGIINYNMLSWILVLGESMISTSFSSSIFIHFEKGENMQINPNIKSITENGYEKENVKNYEDGPIPRSTQSHKRHY